MRKTYDATWLKKHPISKEEYILSGELLPKGGIALIGGDTGVGKSVFVTRLGRDLSLGHSPLGLFAPVKKSVSLFSLEMIGSPFQKRTRHVLSDYPTPEEYEFVEDTFLRLDNWEGARKLGDHINSSGSDIVIIDTLAEAISDESYEREGIKTLVGGLKQLSQGYGTTFILVQHVKKAYGSDSVTLDRITGQRYLHHATDLILGIEEEKGNVVLARALRKSITILKTRYSSLKTGVPVSLDFDFEHNKLFEPSRALSGLCQILWERGPTEKKILEEKIDNFPQVLDEARNRGLIDSKLISITKSSPQIISIGGPGLKEKEEI